MTQTYPILIAGEPGDRWHYVQVSPMLSYRFATPGEAFEFWLTLAANV